MEVENRPVRKGIKDQRTGTHLPFVIFGYLRGVPRDIHHPRRIKKKTKDDSSRGGLISWSFLVLDGS